MRNRISATAAMAAMVLLLTAASTARADEEAKKKAIAAAEAWLELVDKGDFAAGWETAAALFRNAVTAEDFARQVKPTRQAIGKLISREVILSQYETSLPGAPDGEYVVIQFKSVFENKASAIETVTPMKDPDGEWRVSGYFIK